MRRRITQGRPQDPEDEWDDGGPESPNAGRNNGGGKGRGIDERFSEMGNTTDLPQPRNNKYAMTKSDDMKGEEDDSDESEVDIGILS